MANRLDLHEMLCNILGTRNVYFQPPESTKMSYPAIRYRLSEIINTMADNRVYTQSHSYELIVIDKDPDGILKDKISKLPMCRFVRSYTVDNLNHYIFTIFY